jgi:hypothetical protein
MNKIKVVLAAHTESFLVCKKIVPKLIKVFDNLEKEVGIEVRVSWMLEQDDMRPYNCEIRSKQDGRVIEQGGKFFREIIASRKDEIGLHIHFTRGWRFDPSPENQERLIKSAYEKFLDVFEFEPKSFVGGWWYSDSNTIKILESLNFKTDASPVPLYKEKRIKWLFGKIPTPFKITTCNWEECKERKPYHPSYRNPCIKGNAKILYAPNSVNPTAKSFSAENFLSLDRLKYDFEGCVKIFKEFVNSNFKFICIPFHPHSISDVKLVKQFLEMCNNYPKIHFTTLGELA